MMVEKTDHSSPNNSAAVIADATLRKNRRSMLVIFAIAFGSLGGSYLLFYFVQGSEGWGTTNNGEFVDPPVHIADLGLVTEAGAPLGETGQWWLLVNADSRCDADCDHALLQSRQLHILLNKEASRVSRALVSDGSIAADEHLAPYPKALHLIARPDVSGQRLKRGIYIVDPIGNLVFFYSLQDAGKPVLDDLKKLLKLSQIG
jgi:hypothetical protein